MTTPKFCGYDVHRAANVPPAMSEQEYSDLKADIEKNGQIDPIVLIEGKILDGKHRAMACYELGITPKTREWAGECGNPYAYVRSKLKHRNLSKTQIAACGQELLEYEQAEAKERIRNAQQVRHGVTVEKIPQIEQGKARDKVAEALGVNPRYIQDAKKIKEESPETFEKLKSGETTLQQAKKDLYGTRAHEGSIAVAPRETAPEDNKSDTLWSLNYHWKRATKKEKAAFCAEHGLTQNKPEGK